MTAELPRPFGTYTLLKLLARGGMGEIYLARTQGITGFEKYYAVKKLLKKFTHDNDVATRFIDEAKLGARLQHPNIVQVYDLGRVADELYMATEFVDGFDLRRVLRFCHEKKMRIPLDIALFVVREILSGLAYAHRQVDAEGQSINLIHRDISPQNVLVSFEGEVKVIDFGLAKSTQRSQETQANVLLGNFGYMSPEQARGHLLDVRTDVYSAGIVLFELVTGTKRFVEENPMRLLEMVARPTPIVPSDRVPGTPKTIDRIYVKASAPAKEERFDNAEAFRDDVTAALHKINPKASRENLAQFLNHLFLGGQAPAPVDPDALDRSVAIRVRDLHEASDAFQQPAESDIRDRRLHEFAEDAPQTASHPLMRQARAGDTLTHQQLTGEDLAAPSAPTVAAMPAVQLPHMPPIRPAVSTTEETAPQPRAVARSASPVPDISEMVSVTAPHAAAEVDVELAVEAIADEELEVVDLGPSLTEQPTSIYDSPSWPSEADRAAAELEPKGAPLELQRQLEEQETARRRHEQEQRDTHARQQRQAAAQAQAELQRQLDEQLPSPSPAIHKAPVIAASVVASASKTNVVTTVGPPPKRPVASSEQPSIVVAMDLEANEPTVVGSPAPGNQVAATIEVQPVAERRQRGAGFGEGKGHESLIIDFEEGAGEAPRAAEPPANFEPPASDEKQTIRPAAQPLGKRVASSVAQTKSRPAARDESQSGGAMPPPTRRGPR
ncbi:MAG: protein kinase [Deltaproteobacteria bacterium]|nr:protein kinase [Deltaproteobacteria bacterium]